MKLNQSMMIPRKEEEERRLVAALDLGENEPPDRSFPKKGLYKDWFWSHRPTNA